MLTQQMNMSEVDMKKFSNTSEKTNFGWTCPNCGKTWSPNVKACTCTKAKQESSDNTPKWISD